MPTRVEQAFMPEVKDLINNRGLALEAKQCGEFRNIIRARPSTRRARCTKAHQINAREKILKRFGAKRQK